MHQQKGQLHWNMYAYCYIVASPTMQKCRGHHAQEYVLLLGARQASLNLLFLDTTTIATLVHNNAGHHSQFLTRKGLVDVQDETPQALGAEYMQRAHLDHRASTARYTLFFAP